MPTPRLYVDNLYIYIVWEQKIFSLNIQACAYVNTLLYACMCSHAVSVCMHVVYDHRANYTNVRILT